MSRLSPGALDTALAVISGKIGILQKTQEQLRILLDSNQASIATLEAERRDLEAQRYPIHWLPPELLIQIFVLATDTYDATAHIDITPVRLSHVCRKWRDISLSEPILWRRVFLRPDDLRHRHVISSAATAFVSRSRGSAVEVVFSGRPSDPQTLLVQSALLLALKDTQGHVFSTLPPLKSISFQSGYDFMVNMLTFLRNGKDAYPSLQSIDLTLIHPASAHLFDSLRNDNAPVFMNPWNRQHFPSLQEVSVQDVALGCLPLGQLPALRELSLQVTPWAPQPPYRANFLHIIHLARFLACAPNLERLVLIRGGPIFNLQVDPDAPAAFWAEDRAWRHVSHTRIPPVPMEHLRELEWTGAHPDSLHFFFTHFPAPNLELLDVAFVDVNKHNAPLHGPDPIAVASVTADTPAPGLLQPVLELSRLKVLRVECTSGDVLRAPFLKLCFPALETLSIANADLSLRWAGAGSNAFSTLPHLPRTESIFRDPRMPRLTHLMLSAFTVLQEHAPTMLAYMPALEHLECDIVDGVSALLAALAATRAHVGGPKYCPRLSRIDLWCCEDVGFVLLEMVVKLRNGFRKHAEAPVPQPASMPNGRVIKPLRRTARAGTESPLTQEETCAKITEVHVDGCPSISEDDARSLEKWGVKVLWSPPSKHPS
ncbi:hypothetical protein BV25DRAFT_226872 [Artomyces pyxidatus]|uniref:Uncharacterized protein n=1 Tax=Artomyces pyxidatus TaxID=48021 RepID=A0ACB8SFG8_9AGAM|nr:hypothetical protein BV25DRAFT_226872 [Artomyces pyxidatus]